MFRTTMTLARPQRIMTAVVLGLVTAAMFGAFHTAPPGAFVMGVVAAALLLAWAMAPRALVVDGDEVRIERRAWWPLALPRAAIASASPLRSVGAFALRLFGVGGFFGSYGIFTSQPLGRFRLYATRWGTSVLVRFNDGRLPMVLTPDDVDGAIAALDPRPTV